MKEISLEELKELQIKILSIFTEFCEENKITYWIDCGTLLGAVRHKGYIPWDDDIDLGMLRKDFDKIKDLFNHSSDRYKFYCIENNDDFYFAHGKILDTNTILNENGNKISVNIDVFVYDNAPDDEKSLKKMFNRRDIYTLLNMLRIWNNVPKGNLFRKGCVLLGRLLVKVFPKNYFARKIADNSKKYINISTDRIGNFTSYSRVVGSKKIFSSFVDLCFEGRFYKAPIGYDEWLKLFYGDYMKLPPLEKQVSHHVFQAYIKE